MYCVNHAFENLACVIPVFYSTSMIVLLINVWHLNFNSCYFSLAQRQQSSLICFHTDLSTSKWCSLFSFF